MAIPSRHTTRVSPPVWIWAATPTPATWAARTASPPPPAAVSFSNLVINNTGSSFTLIATAGGITSLSSSPIQAVAPHLVVTTQPTAAVTAGRVHHLGLAVDSNQNTLDATYNGPVALTIASGPTGATIQGTSSATISDGVATLANVTLTSSGLTRWRPPAAI